MSTTARLTGLLIALVLIAAALDILPAYAATCSGSTCNGKNPQGTTCQSDAYRVFGVAYPMGNPPTAGVELWYSPSCNANWGRVVVYQGSITGVKVWLEQNGSKYPSSGTPIGISGNVAWSPMRNGSYVTRACGILGIVAGCTAWA